MWDDSIGSFSKIIFIYLNMNQLQFIELEKQNFSGEGLSSESTEDIQLKEELSVNTSMDAYSSLCSENFEGVTPLSGGLIALK